jgi:hypothetical protein
MTKGATVQATYYDQDRKIIISCDCSSSKLMTRDGGRIQHISGRDILTNAQVNIVSIIIATIAGYFFGPYIFS